MPVLILHRTTHAEIKNHTIGVYRETATALDGGEFLSVPVGDDTLARVRQLAEHLGTDADGAVRHALGLPPRRAN